MVQLFTISQRVYRVSWECVSLVFMCFVNLEKKYSPNYCDPNGVVQVFWQVMATGMRRPETSGHGCKERVE